MTDLHRLSIRELSAGLRNKAFSSTELTQHFLKRIDTLDKTLNSFITVTGEQALTQAKLADELLAQGNAGTLTGIPIAQKDIFCTLGVKTSCGSKMLDNFIAPYNATVINKCNDAGLVMLGKTNMDEFAMGSSNESSYYGAVHNPWHLDRVPGGSSGGSASAIAAGLTPFATGTDTGGSIRQPAAFCGITGLKPTYGRVSRYGMIAYASSLDQGGPMGRTAEDCAYLMQVMAGHDTNDSTSINKDVDDYVAGLNQPLKGLRIGKPRQYFDESKGLNTDVAQQIENALNQLIALGAEVREIDLTTTDVAIPAYYLIAPAEASSNLSRFDGVRYGYRCEDPKDLTDLYTRSRSEGFGLEVQRRILIGTYALSAGYYDAYYLKAQKVRRLIQQDFMQAFSQCDVIVCPTTPNVAYTLGQKLEPVIEYLGDVYTIAVNLAGLPAISMPVGFVKPASRQLSSNERKEVFDDNNPSWGSGKFIPEDARINLPVGLQLIGNYWSESKLLSIVHQYQQATDWHTKTPDTHTFATGKETV